MQQRRRYSAERSRPAEGTNAVQASFQTSLSFSRTGVGIGLCYYMHCKSSSGPAADAAKEEGIVQGAAALLRAQSLFRAVSRHPSALAGLVAGLMAASQHSSPQAQQATMECFVLFALRFIRPPQLAVSQVRPLWKPLIQCRQNWCIPSLSQPLRRCTLQIYTYICIMIIHVCS